MLPDDPNVAVAEADVCDRIWLACKVNRNVYLRKLAEVHKHYDPIIRNAQQPALATTIAEHRTKTDAVASEVCLEWLTRQLMDGDE